MASMKYTTGIAGACLALLLWGCAHHGVIAETHSGVAAEWVGTSPGDAPARAFVGGLDTHAPCHSITWHVTLSTNQNAGLPSPCRLTAHYQVPERSNPNRLENGPKVTIQGTWELLKGTRAHPEAVIYKIHAANPQRTLSFVNVGNHVLHLLNADGSLACGNGGWSYTLYRADQAEKPGDKEAALNGPEISYKISKLSTGPGVFGVFEGRTPCHGISRELKLASHAGCIKSKWRVTLFQNPETSAPTTYKVEGSLFREGAREGTWSIGSGAATDAHAVVYQLNPTPTQPALLLLKGDDNVLFFLDQNRQPMVGHEEFGYTLNRVAAK